MKKIMAIALLMALVLAGCAAQPGSGDSQPQSSVSQDNPSSDLPAGEENVSCQGVVLDGAPLLDTWGTEEISDSHLGTQEELDRVNSFLDGLMLEDLESFQAALVPGETGVEKTLSVQQSEELLSLLLQMEGKVRESMGNPPTGGGWTVALSKGKDTLLMTFNGEWISCLFVGEDSWWFFDLADVEAGYGVQDYIYNVSQ